MSEFFLEIYSEDIPSSSQNEAEIILRNEFSKKLNELNLTYGKILTFSTSRRIGISINNLPTITKQKVNIIRGPSVDANELAIKGFMKSQNISNQNLLIKKKIDSKEYFFVKKINKSKSNGLLLKEITILILKEFKWKKSMRWSNFGEYWIRPIRAISCLFNKKVLRFNFAGIKTSNFSFGNFYLNKKKIRFSSFGDFKKKLSDNFVVLEKKKREEIILSKLKNIENEFNIFLCQNQKLLSECADFCENPNIFFGAFEKEFFSLPEFIISNILSEKQKYFSFRTNNGKLSNIFGFVANNISDKKFIIRRGHEIVLKARFKDAIFFINEDKTKKLRDRIIDLKKITYFDGLGTLLDKTERVKNNVIFLSKKFNYELNSKHLEILSICKSDLTTELVKEFPSLQGKVGAYYAENEGYKPEFYRAIADQYLQSSNLKQYSKNIFSVFLSISEKVDHVVAIFMSKKKPSGSRDPFGARRSIIGIIKILLENKININIVEIFNYSIKTYDKQNRELLNEITSFFFNRFLIFMKEQNIPKNLIDSLSIERNKENPFLFFSKLEILIKLKKNKKFKDFIINFKRIDSLLEKTICDNLEPNKKLFISKYEREFYKKIYNINQKFTDENLDLKYNDFFAYCFDFSINIKQLLDNVKINDDDEKIKKNRYRLLNFSKNVLNKHTMFASL